MILVIKASDQTRQSMCVCVCVCCVCVCFLSIHSEHQVRWPYQPGSQEEGHTGFLIHLPSAVRALIFLARRIQPFLFLVDREVEFCVLTMCSSLVGLFFFFFFFQ